MPAAKQDAVTIQSELSRSESIQAANKPERLISKSEVLARVGASYPSIWEWMRQGRFPRSRELGGRVAWLESEINDWIVNRPIRRLKGDPDPN